MSATQHGSKSANQSAKRLGVSRNTLYKRLRERQG
ncbi:helix-turn-helix domain-containing protein [Pseudomonas quasicaspiana]